MYSTQKSTQYTVITQMEREFEKEETDRHTHTYIYITESLCCAPETNTWLLNYNIN